VSMNLRLFHHAGIISNFSCHAGNSLEGTQMPELAHIQSSTLETNPKFCNT
jgi:hypothetical protein